VLSGRSYGFYASLLLDESF